MLADWPAWKRILTSTLFCLCVAILVITAFRGLVPDYPMRLIQGIACAEAGAATATASTAATAVRRTASMRVLPEPRHGPRDAPRPEATVRGPAPRVKRQTVQRAIARAITTRLISFVPS